MADTGCTVNKTVSKKIALVKAGGCRYSKKVNFLEYQFSKKLASIKHNLTFTLSPSYVMLAVFVKQRQVVL